MIDSPRPDGSRAPALGGEPELVKFLIENFELIFSENDVLGRETMDLMATLAMMDGSDTGNARRRTLVMLKPTKTIHAQTRRNLPVPRQRALNTIWFRS